MAASLEVDKLTEQYEQQELEVNYNNEYLWFMIIKVKNIS